MSKIISTGQEAREKLKKGIDLACNCIKTTLGPTGRNAVLGRMDIPPIITNDGVSVARNIEAEDEIENQGVWIVKEACSFASAKGGDGTTTTAVLLQAIVSELFERLKDDGVIGSKKPNVIELMREVDTACAETVKALLEKARPITINEIYKVALVAGEFDWLANIVTEIYKKIGKDGYVTIEEGLKTSYKTFKGIEFNAGYQSEYFINNDARECVIDNPYIFVTNQILDADIIVPMTIQTMQQEDAKGIILIAPDFSRDLINRLNTTKVKTNFPIVALKLPTYDKDDILIDIATLTNAKFFDKNTYTKISDFISDIKIGTLGRADKIIVGDNRTTIVGGDGDTTSRVETIRGKLETTTSLFDRDTLEKRIAYLSGGIATLTIGGDSDFEKTYFKLKAENAVASVQNALKDGVVKGGGVTLMDLSYPQSILSNALKAPYNQIQENSGGKLEVSDDVLDAVSVTISSLKAACSLAGRTLTTEVVIAFKNKKDGSKNED